MAPGPGDILPIWVLLAQALTHDTEHRTHIAAILTQQGIAPPGMDVWTYSEDRINADWSRLWSGEGSGPRLGDSGYSS